MEVVYGFWDTVAIVIALIALLIAITDLILIIRKLQEHIKVKIEKTSKNLPSGRDSSGGRKYEILPAIEIQILNIGQQLVNIKSIDLVKGSQNIDVRCHCKKRKQRPGGTVLIRDNELPTHDSFIAHFNLEEILEKFPDNKVKVRAIVTTEIDKKFRSRKLKIKS